MDSRKYITESRDDADKVAAALKGNRISGDDSCSVYHLEHSTIRLEHEGGVRGYSVYIFSSCPEKVEIARSRLEDLAGVLLIPHDLHPKRRSARNMEDTQLMG